MLCHSIYLHIPFCRHRCNYCDFNTYAGIEDLIPRYVEALCREVELVASSLDERLPVHTVFFGGGTPSLLPAEELERTLQSIDRSFNLAPDLELTLEANPGTLSPAYLRQLRVLGINRLSLGMQSADPSELALLERQHDFNDVRQAVDWSRQAGIENINLDLIFGLPYQNLSRWDQSLTLACGLQPAHFSIYSLTLEHGTPLKDWIDRGLLDQPDSDLAAEMYEWTVERLDLAGYEQYEISNWMRQDRRGEARQCRHNLQYWRNQPYLGFGAGAHGFAGGSRTVNVLAPAAYIRRMTNKQACAFPRTPATAQISRIDEATEMAETMFMGLRLTREGISRKAFHQRFKRLPQDVFVTEIEELLALGLLEIAGDDGDILRLTPQGRLLGNQVFIRFV
jgi:oxygen-independent coproporphyrinogen III oxidase